MAFVAIEQGRTPPRNPILGYDTGPIIEQSSIYIARRSDHFAPRSVPLKPIKILGREWFVVRHPSVSPDGKTIFFEVPDSVVSSTIMSTALSSGVLRQISDATDYCVIWDGEYSGGLLMQRRHIPEDLGPSGVSYWCYLRSPAGVTTKLVEECDELEEFSKYWSKQHGGICPSPLPSEWHH
jgi:hypothetical protein